MGVSMNRCVVELKSMLVFCTHHERIGQSDNMSVTHIALVCDWPGRKISRNAPANAGRIFSHRERGKIIAFSVQKARGRLYMTVGAVG